MKYKNTVVHIYTERNKEIFLLIFCVFIISQKEKKKNESAVCIGKKIYMYLLERHNRNHNM